MAITIDWGNRIIFVPRNDMTLIQSSPFEVRELDANMFRLALKDLEDSEQGLIFPDTHNHNTEIVLGGVTYARFIEIINNYTVTFEDGQYAVSIVGANTNIGDVTNLNQVSIRTANSAGLIVTSGSGGTSGPTASQIAAAVWESFLAAHTNALTMGGMMNILNTRTQSINNYCVGLDFKLDLNLVKTDGVLSDTQALINSLQTAIDIVNEILKYSANRTKIDQSAKTLTIYDDDSITPLKVFNLKDFNGIGSITEIAERMPQ